LTLCAGSMIKRSDIYILYKQPDGERENSFL
jgi:hypothetical protein